jgi:shikimate dehydrogenase
MNDIIRLGLIGDSIATSQSPRLHRLAGAQNGRRVIYDSLVPAERGLGFDALFDHAAGAGYRGVNITYPYKERVVARLRIDDPLVRAIGAVNTVLFDAGGPRGFNTDHSGFVATLRRALGGAGPGAVLMIGAGGVGRAAGFGLAALGADEIRIVDRDPAKAAALAQALAAARPGLRIVTGDDAARLARGAAGLVNCTPVGMVVHPGTPLPREAMAGAAWAFDAVYTPVATRFLADAAAAGLQAVSGYELFVGQGVDAWRLFTGLPVDEARLRADLAAGRDAA